MSTSEQIHTHSEHRDHGSADPMTSGGKISRISERLIHFSLLSFAFFTPFSISGAQISLGLGFLGWVVYAFFSPAEEKEKIVISPVGRAYFFFLGAGLLSIMFADDKLSSLDAFRSLWVFFAFFLGANWIRSLKQFFLLIAILASVASVNALIGIIQYLGGLTLGGQLLISHHPHAVGTYGVSSMTFAGLSLVILISAIPPLFPSKIRMKNILLALPLLLLLFGIIFSCQRGAWIGLIGGLLLLGMLRGIKTFFMVVVALGIGLTAVYKTQPYIRHRVSMVFKLDTAKPINSPSERLLIWRTALKIAQEHPITGTGLDQFRKYAGEIISTQIPPGDFRVTLCHAHSNPLQILATTGVIGFLAFLWLWVTVFREGFRLLRRASREQSLFIIGVLSAVFAFHGEGLVEYTFGDSEIITLVWFLVGGMVATAKMKECSSEMHSPDPAVPTEQLNRG